MTEANSAAIVLAAGGSSRLGQPKQLLQIEGETLIDRAVRVAREAGCSPVLVVLGAGLPGVITHSRLEGAIKVVNRDWRLGMSSSIVRGIEILQSIGADVRGVVLMTCDQPTVSAEHLRALMAAGGAAASLYAGRCGVPAYLPRSRFPELLNLSGDHGARELLGSAAGIELAGGEVDIDTVDDLARAREQFS
jgi:CTP:molybdopterin cytidylyltransferase MocA